MHSEVLVESRSHLLDLTDTQVANLRSIGKQLASSKSFWGDREADHAQGQDETTPERSVVRCTPVTQNVFEVTVNEAVGIIALPGLQLIVKPKIPLDHFHHLLANSPVFPRTGDDETTGAASVVLWDLVASWFLASLEVLLRKGLLSDYEEENDFLPAVRGSIRVGETALTYYQGKTLIACDYDEFGPNTALNRVLRAASQAIAQASFLDQGIRRRARRALARLEDVGQLRRADLRTALDRRTARYQSPLALARHVLAATGRTFEGGSHNAQTFLIRTPELVEEAIRQILREGLAHLVPVKKKDLQLVGSKLRLSPDLVFGSIAVGDVKYKLLGKDWKRTDLYQAVSFATGYRVEHTAVVTFSPTSGQSVPSVQVGDVTLRAITWDCSHNSTPEASARSILDQATRWLTAAQAAARSPDASVEST
jgi:5-methylcytosine-specific restriction enzyme subunit McrC